MILGHHYNPFASPPNVTPLHISPSSGSSSSSDGQSMSKVAAIRRVKMGHGTVEYRLMLHSDSVLPIILGITQFIIILILLSTRS
jgi:hypothetical protein